MDNASWITSATFFEIAVYFETIDLMMNAIDRQRFEQPSFDTYAKMESILIKTLNSREKSEELKFMEKLYKDDVNISVLTVLMEILQELLKDGDYFCFDDIIVKIKELPNSEREMIKEVITLCKLILVNPATGAAGERSFSTACPEAKNMAPFKNEPGTI